MAGRKKYAVNSASGLNVREKPSRSARILYILKDGETVMVKNTAETPEGWKELQTGGFVMAQYLK